MLVTLSPSKGQDFSDALSSDVLSQPERLEDSQRLIEAARQLSASDIGALMQISDKLSDLNHQRFKDFSLPFNESNAKQALLAFTGDVYSGISKVEYQRDDFLYAQDHLRILSGLYGALKPMDLIQPYRLEMKTKLATDSAQDLYSFWGESITQQLNQQLSNTGDNVVVNLASNEYWKSVKPKLLNAKVIDVAFKEVKDGKARILAIYAKRARGMMADYIVRQRIETEADLQQFNMAGYAFSAADSSDTQFVFTRPQPAKKST